MDANNNPIDPAPNIEIVGGCGDADTNSDDDTGDDIDSLVAEELS
jgi:hypothetical protein